MIEIEGETPEQMYARLVKSVEEAGEKLTAIEADLDVARCALIDVHDLLLAGPFEKMLKALAVLEVQVEW